MMDKLTVTGKIVIGDKKGALFTQLEWVQEQCQKVIGSKPFPGTLNLEIAAEKVPEVEALLQKDGVALMPPNSDTGAGHLYPVSIMGVPGAILAAAESNRLHDHNIVELIAATSLKSALDVEDGDEIMFVATYRAAP